MLDYETKAALSKLPTVMFGLNADDKTKQDFMGYARKALEKIVRNKTEDEILTLMKHWYGTCQ